MRKWIYYLTLGIAAGSAFLVVIIVILLKLFDANAYKDEISGLVFKQTGRELVFHGTVKLTVYPSLGVRLGAISLNNAEGFGPQPMVEIGEADVQIDMVSLISLQPQVERVFMRGLELDLQKNSSGMTNWDDLVDSGLFGSSLMDSGSIDSDSIDSDRPLPEVTASQPLEIGPPMPVFESEVEGSIAGLDLQQIRISWKDQQAGNQFLIENLELSTGRILPNQPFKLSLQADAQADNDLEMTVELQAMVNYQTESKQLNLEQVVLKLNEFEIGGYLTINHFAKPSIKFDLRANRLDLDALMPPPSAEQAVAATEASNATSASISSPGATNSGNALTGADRPFEWPLETLRDLNLTGQFQVAQMKLQKLLMSDFKMTLKARKGLLSVRPLTFGFYGGVAEISAVANLQTDQPRFGVQKSFRDVRLGDFLKDYDGTEVIDGKLSAQVNLTTRGESVAQLRRNSNGTVRFELADGVISGFNLRHEIEAAKAKARGETSPPERPRITDFSAVKLTGQLRDGVFFSDDLSLQAPLLRATGHGQADLLTGMLDYQLEAEVVKSLQGQSAEPQDHLDGLKIPLRLSGPFDSIEIDLQLDEMLKAEVVAKRAAIKAEIESQKKAIRQALEAETRALAESRNRKLEKKRQLELLLKQQKEEAKQRAKAKAKQAVKDALLEKLLN